MINEILEKIKFNKTSIRVIKYKPATKKEILYFEKSLAIKLPYEVKEFYKFCNGFESEEEHDFRIIPLGEIIENKKDFKPNQFYIAEHLIYCDVWTIDLNPNDYGIYNCDENNDWLHLTNSFSEFLNCYLTNGLYENNGIYDLHKKVRE